MISPVKNNPKVSKLENHLLKKVGKAIGNYEMLGKNDRILVAVSGGKDSWSMLRLLILKNRQLPPEKKYDLTIAHVNFQLCKQHDRDFDELFKEYGLPYHIISKPLPEKNDPKLSYCFWCSWNRRKILFETAQKCSCNKVALGHHLDDIIETLLMNQFFYGEISTMPPKISLFDGELDIIRPLAYIPEKLIAEYAAKTNLPFCSCECPHSTGDSRRQFVKKLIGDVEQKCSYVRINLFRSMKRIKEGYLA